MTAPAAPRVVLSLFDASRVWSEPYHLAGYRVIRVCLPEHDVRTFDYRIEWNVHGILAAPPCTEFAGSGARWWKSKPTELLDEALELVDVTLGLVDAFKPKWYAIENPVGRLRRLRPQLGDPRLTFDPCDFAGWADDPQAEAYTKRTQLFGSFALPEKRRVEPIHGSKMHRLPPSPERAALRSVTPQGFARAFFQANP